jgi:hypothetical protein
LGIHLQEDGTASYARFMKDDLERYRSVVEAIHMQVK